MDLTAARIFAVDMALNAGAIIKENFQLGMAKEWKADHTPVTATDKAINRILIERVQELFPDHAVWGEEESLEKDSPMLWVCDPVDGTFPFSHGIPTCTFSLALVQDGEPILGVVYDPFEDNLYVGEKGKGATRNGMPMHVSTAATLDNVLCAYEHFPTADFHVGALAEHLEIERNVCTFKMCSFIYMSMRVASGEFGFSFFPKGNIHDVASVKIIVEEAGGKTTDLFGEPQRYDRKTKGFIASNGLLHDEIVTLSKQYVRPLAKGTYSE